MTDYIGLARGTVKVVDYNPKWPELFNQEKRRLKKILGGHVHSIEHIGSTAVPGLGAKPIIDIIASVDDLSVYKQLVKPLSLLGYEFMPSGFLKTGCFYLRGPE